MLLTYENNKIIYFFQNKKFLYYLNILKKKYLKQKNNTYIFSNKKITKSINSNGKIAFSILLLYKMEKRKFEILL
jgi:hypothetical protein